MIALFIYESQIINPSTNGITDRIILFIRERPKFKIHKEWFEYAEGIQKWIYFQFYALIITIGYEYSILFY